MGSPSARAVVLTALLVSAFASAVDAQQAATSAAVTGTVRDQTEAVIGNALVRIRNAATNQVWDARSDDRGRFRLLFLPVGSYELTVEAPGFATTTVKLTLAIGQAIDAPITLVAAGVSEAVSVTAEPPLIDAARTHVASTIEPREIEALPLNGRNYLDLALLAPNVSRTNTRAAERFAETSAVPGTGISVSGQRNLGNTFIVDGLSANDDAADLAGTYYSEEVIREFQVLTSGGTAEFGRASAGVVTVITRSGTNDLSGRAYGFFRNDRLDARNALASGKDPLTQQQYGVSVGGPLVRDRTFWFGNVERTVQDKTGFVTIAPAAVTSVNATLDRFGYGGPRAVDGPFETGYHTTNLFGRVDHQATANTRAQFRYGFYDVRSPNARGVGGLNDVSRGTRLDDRDQTAAVSLLSLLSSRIVNEARAQFTRSRLAAPANDLIGPAVTIAGVASLGVSTSSPTSRDLDLVQAADTVTLQAGAHVFKAGADFLHNRVTIDFPGALQGSYTFQSLANLQRGVYVQFQQAFGAPSVSQSNPNLGVFVQDEWRAGRGITVDAGLRYDLQWLPAPIQLDRDNISPRVGVAWASGDGRTVVRTNGGLYFDRIPLRAMSNALQRDGVGYRIAVLSFGQTAAPSFPEVLPSFPSGTVTAITSIDPNIRNGASRQFGVQVERAFGTVASASAGYSYLRGREIIMSRNINVPTLTAAEAAALGVPNLGRPNPVFGNISQYQSIGDSWFNSLTMTLGTRARSWGSVRVSYTLSKALDDAGNAFFSAPQNNFDVLDDKGPSDNDQRHRVTVSGTVGGVRRDVQTKRSRLRGVEIGYVFWYSTGLPFNVQTGGDRNTDTTVNDRPEGVGRNSARMPSSSALDVRLSRAFSIGRHHRVEAMLEAFNVLNRVNVLNVNNTFGQGTTPLASFGQPTLAGDPRQMQMGIRWSF